MSGASRSERVTRGKWAQDALRLPVLQQAADELNRRAFELFLSAGEGPHGDLSRANAARIVHGAEAFLDILKEWVVEARDLLEEVEDENV